MIFLTMIRSASTASSEPPPTGTPSSPPPAILARVCALPEPEASAAKALAEASSAAAAEVSAAARGVRGVAVASRPWSASEVGRKARSGAGEKKAGAYIEAMSCMRGCTKRSSLCLSARRVSSEKRGAARNERKPHRKSIGFLLLSVTSSSSAAALRLNEKCAMERWASYMCTPHSTSGAETVERAPPPPTVPYRSANTAGTRSVIAT
mmetsp:Transcript_33272/g.66207  ORF Transcript_33272/g.66207 Transcript_33272/m.66207 type:complete len:208 (-) Transcript_33272:300-923(-)